MKLEEARRRLPVVNQFPKIRGRRPLPLVEGEVPKPGLAVWEFTLACDHGCLHCGTRAHKARPDELTTDESLKLVEDLAQMGVGEINFIGGEAYLRNDLVLIVRRARELGVAATMTTGGLNLTKERAEALVEAGINNVSVSIDGMEASHDRVRDRQGSWKRALQALENMYRAGSKVSVNSQFNRINYTEHINLLPLIKERGAHSWQIQITIPHGNATENFDIVLQPYMLLDVYEEIGKLVQACKEANMIIWPGNNLGYFGPLEQAIRGVQLVNGHYNGCKAGQTTISIESDGTIKPCPTLGSKTNQGGNIRYNSIQEIWARAPEVTYTRRRTLDELWGFCRDCYYADLCRGGCTATSEPTMGRPGNNPYCHHRALELDAKGERERLELVLDAGKQPFGFGAFKLIRESNDPAKAAAEGPIEVTHARVSRAVEEMGAGRPLKEGEGHAKTMTVDRPGFDALPEEVIPYVRQGQ